MRIISKVVRKHFNHQIITDQEWEISIVYTTIFLILFFRFNLKGTLLEFITISSLSISILFIFFCRLKLRRICCHFIDHFLLKSIPSILIECFSIETKEYHDFTKGFIWYSFSNIIEKEYKNSIHFCFFDIFMNINFFNYVMNWICFKLFYAI